MGQHYDRWKQRRRLKSTLSELVSESARSLFIHYSCESFDNIDTGSTIRISAISVYSPYTGETDCYSIHSSISQSKRKKPQRPHPPDQTEIEAAERKLIRQFKGLVEKHHNHIWIHWEMRDATYGFRALQQRSSSLGVTLPSIPHNQKFNLMAKLRSIYGDGYAPHSRLLSLAEMNSIVATDALPGKLEGDYFAQNNFFEIAQSSQRKVRIMFEVANRASDGTLKTNMKWHRSPLVAAAGMIDWALDCIWIKGVTLIMAIWGFISAIYGIVAVLLE